MRQILYRNKRKQSIHNQRQRQSALLVAELSSNHDQTNLTRSRVHRPMDAIRPRARVMAKSTRTTPSSRLSLTCYRSVCTRHYTKPGIASHNRRKRIHKPRVCFLELGESHIAGVASSLTMYRSAGGKHLLDPTKISYTKRDRNTRYVCNMRHQTLFIARISPTDPHYRQGRDTDPILDTLGYAALTTTPHHPTGNELM